MTKSTAARSPEPVSWEGADMLEQFPELYRTLRQIARRERRRNPSNTISTTVVVNETWLKLERSASEWRDKRHYLATAALAMRQLLVDYARRNATEKRSQVDDCPLFENQTGAGASGSMILALHDALISLEQLEPQLARLVELRFFVGLTLPETAECLDVSPRSASREWDKAKAFIKTAMQA